MAGRARVEIEGLNRLITTARKAGADLSDLKEAHRHAAEYVVPVAVPMTPTYTGELKGTIRTSATTRAGTIKAGSRAVPYANIVQWGDPHRNIKAQPWLTTAAQISEPLWITAYETEMLTAISRVKGK